ncbi:hypothetical protein BDD26_3631 [Xenorhabdus cabanillasii]|uniref:Uncharacterized protein n=1 Tax=Xenorhabdus cabanillasii TaxID=351673 RepID=A0A3D9UV90_9GAMM|nr:hypothetical protein [Xenorhabdus cabanillasii]REF28681.1 hypothetical protein BDD26_3631 [Xenorhabdus cabanillasii]
MATLVETLLVALKLDMSGFAGDAHKAIQALDDLDKKAGGASTAVVKLSDDADKAADSTRDFDQSNQDLAKSMDKLNTNLEAILGELSEYGDKTKKYKEKTQDWSKSVNVAVKALTGLFTTILVSSGLAKLVNDVSRSNDQLYFLSKNLGMNAETIKKWQNVAEMSGGSADGMAATMTSLNKSLWDLVTMGDASILPFFNALGVGVVDSYGKIRNLDDILLDMADSMSKMERPQAYNIAKNMGLDEGTINTLLEGRDAIQKRLDAQKNLVISTKEELELNRKLKEQNSVLGQQWEGLKTLVANYLTPHLIKFSERVSGFLDYLNRNRETAISVFKGVATIIGITLIPMIIACGSAFLAMFAPLFTGVGLIALLSLGLLGLYDDYQTWKKGGDSLLPWDKWEPVIKKAKTEIENLGKDIKKLGRDLLELLGINLDNWSLSFELESLQKSFNGLSETISHLFAALNHLNDGNFDLAWEELKQAWNGSEQNKQETNTIGSKAGERHRAAFGNAMPDWYISANNWLNGLLGINPYIPTKPKVLGSPVTETTLDIPTGDPEIDRLKAKVRRGEMTLDELNNIILGSKPNTTPIPQKGNTRGERNNNPLNIEYAKQRGATVENHPEQRFAKFNSEYIGLERTAWQLRRFFNGQGKPKKLQTVADIISAWAPLGGKDKNRTEDYIDRVAQRLGVGRNDRLDLNNHDVMYALMNAMSPEEIGKPLPYSKQLVMAAIKGQGDPMVNLANNISAFSDAISNPIVPNMDMNAPREFLSQTHKIQNMPMTGATNNVKVDLNGDINVTTTANTVKGTVTDAGEAARLSLSQIIPSMG